MKPRNDPQEVYREVLSKLARNLRMFKTVQRCSRNLAVLGGSPDGGFGGGIAPAVLDAERNQLLHEWLPSIAPDSVRSCARLIRLLEAQRNRVLPEIERLRRELRLVCSGLATIA